MSEEKVIVSELTEYSEEEKKAYAEKKKEALNAEYKTIEENIEKIFTAGEDPAAVKKLLDLYSDFRSLGLNNAILLYSKFPNAKEIHPVKYWADHNYSARKGTRSFVLIGRTEYTKADGSKGVGHNLVKYFDVSQTNAPYTEPQKKTYATHALIKGLLNTCPIKYENYNPEASDQPWDDNVIAKYIPESRAILVRKNLSFEMFFTHFATQLAMSMLDRGGDFVSNQRRYLFEAQCIAYLLCRRYNIDTSVFDFEKIPDEIMNYDTTQLKSTLYEIIEVNKVISDKLYRNIQNVLKGYQKEIDEAQGTGKPNGQLVTR